MKRNKLFIAAIVAIVLTVALCASACVTKEDKQINDAFKIAAGMDRLKVEVSDDSGTFYIYDNGKTTDLYGLNVKFENVVGAKGEAYAFTADNLKEGYVCERDASGGDISLSGQLQNTGSLGLDGATVTLKANTVTEEVTDYVITYTDGAYKVRITLT